MPIGNAASGPPGLPLTGGTLTGELTIAPAAGRELTLTPPNTGVEVMQIKDPGGGADLLSYSGDGTISMRSGNGSMFLTVTDQSGNGKMTFDSNASVLSLFKGGLAAMVKAPATSGALSTVAPVSGTQFQCSTTFDVFLCVPFTGDATNNAATLLIELSPDNVTYSTLDTLSIAAALNLTGAVNVPVTLAVPVRWRVKLTATHGTIGTCTFYPA